MVPTQEKQVFPLKVHLTALGFEKKQTARFLDKDKTMDNVQKHNTCTPTVFPVQRRGFIILYHTVLLL
jgi:hypothetical protein